LTWFLDYTLSIVCSTTGNGDSPENADSFWRTIKKRTLPKDLLCGLKFCVLALGDSNYDKFCFMGKAIDKRFSDLGATRLMDIFCADEPTDLEEVVESWKSQCQEVISA
jgi:methionine synthase reductase